MWSPLRALAPEEQRLMLQPILAVPLPIHRVIDATKFP